MARTSANIRIKGIKPILFNTFPLDTFSSDKKKEGKTGDNPESWKQTVLMDENRRLYIFSTYLTASISTGGKEIKMGRGNISKKVASIIEVMENKIFLDDRIVPPEEELTRNDTDTVYLDVRAVVNPMTKGRNLRYRIAVKPGWEIEFNLHWDDKILSKEQIKQCVENAGSLTGIGDGRSIGFGRYQLVSFKMNA
jgi:hypothetical protein